MAKAIDWLLNRRNADHGWGYLRGGPTELMPTCFALLSIVEAYRSGMKACEQTIKDGLKVLVDRYRKPAGCFGDTGPLTAIHTIYAILMLQAAQQAKLSVYSQEERQAIAWLLGHPEQASKQVEEPITIDPNGRANYGFMFMTETLLIRILLNSQDKGHRDSQLAKDAMFNLQKNRDANGGFYGYRVFSWSTAKALSALGVVQDRYKIFPRRPPEYTGIKASRFVIAFAVLLLASFAFYLTQLGRFGWLQAGFFIFLTLSLLLAYGAVGEKTFKELFQNLLATFKFKEPAEKRKEEKT